MEKTVGGVRTRVFFPDESWERFKHGAELLGMEERRFVETCALVGLRVLTISVINPLATAEVNQSLAGAMEAAADREAAELAEELEAVKNR